MFFFSFQNYKSQSKKGSSGGHQTQDLLVIEHFIFTDNFECLNTFLYFHVFGMEKLQLCSVMWISQIVGQR